MATYPLLTYLNDHLAGAQSALQLLDDVIESTKDEETREFLNGIRVDVADDRRVLEEIIGRVGGSPSVVRQAGGWLTEKLTQLKLLIDDPSDGPLRRLEALELLSVGIAGKAALWRALSIVSSSSPELESVNFRDLIQRAADQHARVEAQRTDAARVALSHRRDASATPEIAVNK